MMTEYLFYNDGNNLLLEGDFGYIKYNNVTYFSSQIRFYNPSLHTFNNNRMPLEMQIIHQDNKNNQLTVSVFFKYSNSDYSLFLSKLGFDSESLRYQRAYEVTKIKNEIHLENFVDDSKDFFAYKSKMFLPPCKGNSLNLLITDVMNISKRQLLNFPKMILNKNRKTQARKHRKIYISFNEKDIKIKLKKQKEQLAKRDQLDKQNKILEKINKKNDQNSFEKGIKYF